MTVKLDQISFGDALSKAQEGGKITRTRWKGAYVVMKSEGPVGQERPFLYKYHPATPQDDRVWFPTQGDLFAKDWMIFEHDEC